MESVKDKDKITMLSIYLGRLKVAISNQNISDILISLAYIIGFMFGNTNEYTHEVTWSTDIVQLNGNYLLSYIISIRNNNLAHVTRNKLFKQFSNTFSKYYLETYELLIDKEANTVVLEAFTWLSNNLPKVQKYLDENFAFETMQLYATINNTTIEAIISANKDKSLNQLADELAEEINI